MPTSLFSEMDRGSNGGGAGVSFEDQRALQLAFELSMLGIPEGSSGCPGAGTGNGTNNDPDPLQTAPAVFEESRSKKSQNMTECVPVPSSEHVAEIVGRQGKCAPLLLNLAFLFAPPPLLFLPFNPSHRSRSPLSVCETRYPTPEGISMMKPIQLRSLREKKRRPNFFWSPLIDISRRLNTVGKSSLGRGAFRYFSRNRIATRRALCFSFSLFFFFPSSSLPLLLHGWRSRARL